MLSESKDGGKKFNEIAKDVHVDYHAIWIAPNDPQAHHRGRRRRLRAHDRRRQALVVLAQPRDRPVLSRRPVERESVSGLRGVSRQQRVLRTVELAGSRGHPRSSLDRRRRRRRHVDGARSGRSELVWTDLQDGASRSSIARPRSAASSGRTIRIGKFSRAVRLAGGARIASTGIRRSRSHRGGAVATASQRRGIGGNVVFQSTDRGETGADQPRPHAQPQGTQAPDRRPARERRLGRRVFRHDSRHRGLAARSTARSGSAPTTGYVQADARRRRQLAATSRRRASPEYGRVETVAPSPLVAGTAYAIVDNHRLGDYAPYLFVTHDYGTTWTKIVNGLPSNQYVRTVRPDIHNPYLLYAGTETGLWISFDAGAHWQRLPHKSAAGLGARHSRPAAVRRSWSWPRTAATRGSSTTSARFSSSARARPPAPCSSRRGPPTSITTTRTISASTRASRARIRRKGAIVDFYQSAPQKSPPSLQVLDASGRVVRTVSGTHKVKGKDEPVRLEQGRHQSLRLGFHRRRAGEMARCRAGRVSRAEDRSDRRPRHVHRSPRARRPDAADDRRGEGRSARRVDARAVSGGLRIRQEILGHLRQDRRGARQPRRDLEVARGRGQGGEERRVARRAKSRTRRPAGNASSRRSRPITRTTRTRFNAPGRSASRFRAPDSPARSCRRPRRSSISPSASTRRTPRRWRATTTTSARSCASRRC